jgi:hypothetical protein
MKKTSTIPTLAALAALALATNSTNATTIFAADFQDAVDQSAGSFTLANLNAGTETGIWSGTEFDNSLLDTDGSNRGALFEQDGVNLTATFSDAGVLADGVTVSYDATLTRGITNGTGRTAVMKGIASDGKVLFVLGLQADLPVVGKRLIAYSADFTPASGTTHTIPPYISLGDEFTQGTSDYNDAIMETIRLELTTNSFDVYINGDLASAAGGIDYFSGATAAGDIDQLNFQTDNKGGAWYDNFDVQQIPEPSTAGLAALGLLALARRRRRA